MRQNDLPDHIKALARLRAETLRLALFASVSLLAGYWVLQAAWDRRFAAFWLLVAGAFAVYQFRYLWRNLEANHPQEGGQTLYDTLGPANRITVVRAVLAGALAGFLPGPWPQNWLAWAPGVLYLAIAILDFVDGYVARVTKRSTRLGELMDMQWDGAGLLFGAALAVRYGQTPAWFLVVALARYIFLLGEWLLRRSGKQPFELDHSMIRRALAGMMMGFTGVVLLPVFTPPPTHVAAALFVMPFLVHFTRDFLWVSGNIGPRAGGRSAAGLGLQRAARNLLPLVIRAIEVILLVLLLVEQRRLGFSQPGIAVVAALALPALVMGAAGRVVALAVLLSTGFGLQISPAYGLYWLILLNSTLLFLVGTGRFSLWKPEEWLIHNRAGEAR